MMDSVSDDRTPSLHDAPRGSHSGRHSAHAHLEIAGAFKLSMRRKLAVAAVVLAVLTVAGVVVLWPGGRDTVDRDALGVSDTSYPATVTAVEEFTCPGEVLDDAGIAPSGNGSAVCAAVTFRLEDGPDRAEERSVSLYDIGHGPRIGVGERIIVPYIAEALPEYRYSSQFERERGAPMLMLFALFAALVVAQGRLRGFAALGGLLASIGVIIAFVLPAIVGGSPPVAVAIVAAAAISFLALYLAHGFSPLTTVALLGTLGSLAVVAALSATFTAATRLSGLSEETQYLRAMGGELDFAGLLLAGTILGALGALDDMTVTQASAVAELRVANPAYRFPQLYRAGMRIGRDHIASTVNTLALAYAGASLPLLLWFVSSEQSFGRALTSELVATEVVRTLVGSVGLVVSVPLTTALASRLVGSRRGDPDPAATP
jgi:uncharacterized membrane protein